MFLSKLSRNLFTKHSFNSSGITSPHISDKPLLEPSKNHPGKNISWLEFIKESLPNNQISPKNRMVSLGGLREKSSYRAHGINVTEQPIPTHEFLITEKRLTDLTTLEQRKGKPLSANEIMSYFISLGDFSTQCLNDYNIAYFSQANAFSEESDLAALFVSHRETNAALANYITGLFDSETIQIKELSTGSRSRWKLFESLAPKNKSFEITLTDFSTEILPGGQELASSSKCTFSKEVYNLNEDFKYIEPRQRYDVMLATYAFDSVWQNGDITYLYEPVTKEWYKLMYRLSVPEEYITSGNSSQDNDILSNSKIYNVYIEIAYEQVDPTEYQFGEYLKGREVTGVVSVPAGLINRVDQAFQTQISDQGVFIIGEIAHYDPSTMNNTYKGFSTSGIAAKYKIEDLWIAEQELTKMGYKVSLLNLSQFIEQQTGIKMNTDFLDNGTPSSGTCIMTVRKP